MAAGKAGAFQIAFYFTAITGCFCVYSLIQERLMTVGFGPEKEVFKYSVFIVLVNRLVTCVVAAASLQVLGQPLAPSAPLLLFAVPSVANVIGSSAQYEALKYVSFPLQALSKCAKSLPVMAWSWVTNTRKYYAHDYLSAATVTLGCMLFVLTGDITAPDTAVLSSGVSAAASFTATGLGLLAVFMVFDGLTCTSQDKLFSSFNMHSCNQLLYTAAWSALLSAGFLAGSGQAGAALAFVRRHPQCLWLMVLQSVVSTTVQLFIVFTIKQYGALNFALMMTLRQFLSIVLSCVVFAHSLSAMQWLGTLLVIGGLLARSLEKAAGRIDGRMDRKVSGAGGLIEVGDAADAVAKNKGSPPRGIAAKSAAGGEQQPLLSKEDAVALANGVASPGGGKSIAAARPLIPIIAGAAPMVSVLQPFGNVLSSLPSGELKEKPG